MTRTSSPARTGDDVATLRGEVREFLRESRQQGLYEPRCDAWIRCFDPEFSRALAKRGWVGMCLPAEYGGGGRSPVERHVVVEELLAGGAPVAAHWVADRQSGPAILRFGTEAQRRAFLPHIAAGELYFAIGMSEPEAGSDLRSVRTTAVRDGEGWRVNGSKVWTSHAHRCQYLILLCRTDGASGPEGETRLSQFIVDLSLPGISIRPIVSMNGEHHFNEVVFEEAHLPGSALLGQEGNGWQQVTAELANERSGPERFLATFSLLSELSRRAPADGEWDAVIGRLASELGTLRQMSAGVARRAADGDPDVMRQASIVKVLGTQFDNDVIEAVRQLRRSWPSMDAADLLDRHLADAVMHAPGFSLRGGTTEILNGIIAKGLPHDA